MRRKIKFLNIDGKSLVENFIRSLDKYEEKKVIFTLDYICKEKKPNNKILKKLVNTDDIWEIRVKVPEKQIRIFCFFDNKDLIIATNGYFKKQQKTDKRKIKMAEKLKKLYFENK